ncbi:MAG: hypothetical protein JW770_00285 [Actinobacteria bacterium]|nr:hypothetical protein [Actinomycetota bacterium]
MIQAGILLSVPVTFLIFRSPLNTGIVLFILAGFFAMSTAPLCIRVAQDIFPFDVSLASSLVLGASSGSAAAVIILLGRVADIIGITKTVNIALILPAVSGLFLFLFPVIKKKTGV